MTELSEMVKELRVLLANATPGEWSDDRTTRAVKSYSTERSRGGSFNIVTYPMRTDKSLLSHGEWEANVELITLSKKYLPKLLEAAERAEQLEQRVKVLESATIQCRDELMSIHAAHGDEQNALDMSRGLKLAKSALASGKGE